MAIVDAINKITGKSCGGSIEDALQYMKKEETPVAHSVPELTVTVESNTATVTTEDDLADIISDFLGGTLAHVKVTADDAVYMVKNINLIRTYSEDELATDKLVLTFADASATALTITGTYDYSDDSTVWASTGFTT